MEEPEGLHLETIKVNMVWFHGLYSESTCSHNFSDDSKSLVSGCRSLYKDVDEISDICQSLNFYNFALRQNEAQTIVFPRAHTHTHGHTYLPLEKCKENPLFIKGWQNHYF